MFPIDRYRFYQSGNKTFAVSSYAGHTVKGVSKCDTRDTFSQEKGRELAAARCDLKVAKKRFARAQSKFEEAMREKQDADKYLEDMLDYKFAARDALVETEKRVRDVLDEM